MARDLQLAMTLLARDQGSKVIRQALQETVREVTNAQKAEERLGNAREQSAQSGIRASRTLQQEYQRAASAREILGIRAERTIQREISETQAAYMRLLRTGTMTEQEQSRAFDAMTRKVSRLREELNGAGQSLSRMERVKTWGSNAMAIAGGVTAAGMVVAPAVRNQMNYEEKLAYMANTVFSDRDIAGRRSGMQSMDQLIRNTVRVGGGNKDSAAETLNTLLASGFVDYTSVEKLLPVIQKYSTSSGANPDDIANISLALKRQFQVSDAEMPTAINMAVKAGQMGSFELKNMAKWLPDQLSQAHNNGMSGLSDFAVLLGLNQASAITAGTKDEAGNNVVNLLQKVMSQDTKNAFSRIKYNGKGVDLSRSLIAARGKGMNTLDAFVAIVDKIVSQNPEYRELEKKLNNTKDESARRRIMESQLQILSGSDVGQIVNDRQALTALIAYRSNRKYVNDVITGVNDERNLPSGKMAGDIDFDLMSSINKYKLGQLENTRDFAQMDSVKSLSDVLGKLSGDLNDYAGAYPGLTKAMAGAELAIKAMTVAAWAFAGIKFFSNGGTNLPSKAPVPPGTPPVSGTGFLSGMGRLLGFGSAATAIATFTTNEEDEEIATGSAKWANLHAKYGQDRIDRARRLYQPWYQFGKGYASENEAWLSQLDKDEAAGTVPAEHDSWWSPPTNLSLPATANGYAIPPFMQGAQSPSTPSQQIIRLEVDGKTLAEVVNQANGQSSNRGPQGGPY